MYRCGNNYKHLRWQIYNYVLFSQNVAGTWDIVIHIKCIIAGNKLRSIVAIMQLKHIF